MKCVVSGCNEILTENDSFNLPRNKYLKQWVDILNLDKNFVRPSTRICKNHFNPSLIKKLDSGRLQLTSDAVPSFNLPRSGNLPIKRILKKTVVRTKANEVFVITEINDPIDLKIVEAQQMQAEKNSHDQNKSENTKQSITEKRPSPEKPFLITDSGIQLSNNTSNKKGNSTADSNPQPAKLIATRKIYIPNLNQLKVSQTKNVSISPSATNTSDSNGKTVIKVTGTLPQGRKLIKFVKNGKTYIKFLDSKSSVCVAGASSNKTDNSTEVTSPVEIPMTATAIADKVISSETNTSSNTETTTTPTQVAGKRFVKIIRQRTSTVTNSSPTTSDIPQIVSVTSLNPEAKKIKLESGASGSEAPNNSVNAQKQKEMMIKIRELKKNFEAKNKSQPPFTNIKNQQFKIVSVKGSSGSAQEKNRDVVSDAVKKRTSKFKLGCSSCKYIFPTRQQYDTHLETYHKKDAVKYKNLECEHCHEPFISAKTLNFHLKESHTKRQALTCTYCNVEFTHYMKFFKHISAHDDIEVCYICGDFFKLASTLGDHIMGHFKQMDFSCIICGRNFINEKFLKNHQEICAYIENVNSTI